MALDEGGWWDRIPIELVGSDASEALVERARAGVYGERALRNLSPARRARWFRREQAGWRIDPALHGRVRWARANLLDEAQAGPLAAADVVFCRNVLIYFSDDAIVRVARMLARHMPDTGWLFLGASESLMRLATDFTMDEVGPAFAYVRKTRATSGGDLAPPAPSRRPLIAQPEPR
jgi:chemotaxis protein methyltransferase CheR